MEEAKHAVPRVKAALKGELKIPTPSDENFQLDGKPLTDIEKEAVRKFRAGIPFAEAECGTWRALSPVEDALIKALRDVSITHVPDYNTSVLSYPGDDKSKTSCSCYPIAFITSSTSTIDEAIIDDLKRIKAEKEAQNEAE